MADGDDVPSRGPQLQAVNCVFVALAFLATVLRCYVRMGLVKAFGIDDWMMVAAMASFTVYCSCSLTGVHYGTGRHHKDLTEEGIAHARKYWWFCYLFYATTMICCKISIGWFLLRITAKRLYAWIIYAAVATTVVTGIVFFFVTLFQCHPISYFWDKNQDDGTCVKVEIIMALAYLYSATSVVSDFILAVLPIFLISKLQMERRAKLVLAPLLVMGCIASSAVVVRFPYIKDFDNPDFLWATLDIAIWSTVEQGLAITAGSLATLRPLVKKLGLSLRFSREGSGEGASSNRIGSRRMAGYGRGVSRQGLSTNNEFDLARFKQQGKPIPEHDVEAAAGVDSPGKRSENGTGRYFWGAKTPKRDNESEEELRDVTSSKEVLTESESISPKSFLASEKYK
ncbi:hypothetical protein MKZ38_007187 [Zalerion maritima]|uniref:Rhodopsin domain-containing protein n=1 Tax=Zalerion maritima TaxID=339359 RepID=A0AAD5RJ66_9PEZI|nr:hypothetical protein MKZ38_007187 [Zalerion maritima]